MGIDVIPILSLNVVGLIGKLIAHSAKDCFRDSSELNGKQSSQYQNYAYNE
jgi:hypothetical protein